MIVNKGFLPADFALLELTTKRKRANLRYECVEFCGWIGYYVVISRCALSTALNLNVSLVVDSIICHLQP